MDTVSLSINIRLCLLLLLCGVAENQMQSWAASLRQRTELGIVEGSGTSVSQGLPELCSAEVVIVYRGITKFQWHLALPFLQTSLLRLVYHTELPVDVELERYLQGYLRKHGKSTSSAGIYGVKAITLKINAVWQKSEYNSTVETGVFAFTVQRLNISSINLQQVGSNLQMKTGVYRYLSGTQVRTAIAKVSEYTKARSLRLLSLNHLSPSFYTMAEYNRQRGNAQSLDLVDDEDYDACEERGPRQIEVNSGQGTDSPKTSTHVSSVTTTGISATTRSSAIRPLTGTSSARRITTRDTARATPARRRSSSAIGNLEISLITILSCFFIILVLLVGLLLYHKQKHGDGK